MDARLTYPASPAAERIEALRLAAGRAHEADIFRALRRAVDAVLGWPERARLRQQLRGMTDRDLADIGLTRGEIDAALEGKLKR